MGLGIFLLAAAYLAPFWNRVGLDSDEAKIILGTLRALRGERLYVDVFEFVPPGLYALVGLVFRTAGERITPLRAVVVLNGALIVTLAWAVALRATRRPWLALAPAAVSAAFGVSLWCIASVHWLSTALALICTWALLEVIRYPAPWRPWFLAGLSAGAVLLTAQHKGVALLAACGCLVALYVLHAIRELGRPRGRLLGPEDALGGGIVLVLLPPVVALAVGDQLWPMLDAAFGWTRQGYGIANRVSYGYGADVLFGPARWVAQSSLIDRPTGFLVRAALLYAAPICLLALTARGMARCLTRRIGAGWDDAVIGLVGVAMWATTASRPDVLHLITVAPWAALAGTLLLAPAETSCGTAMRWVRRVGVAVLVLVTAYWAVSDQMVRRQWASLWLGPLGFVKYPRAAAPHYSRDTSDFAQTVAFIRNATAPEEPIFVYPYAPYFYYLADRPNPTPYNICIPGYQGERAERLVIDILEGERVPFVILDPTADPTLMARALPGYDRGIFEQSPLTQYIRTRYVPAAEYGYVRILRRRGA